LDLSGVLLLAPILTLPPQGEGIRLSIVFPIAESRLPAKDCFVTSFLAMIEVLVNASRDCGTEILFIVRSPEEMKLIQGVFF